MKTDNSPEDRVAEIEDHIKRCPACSRKAQQLDRMLSSLSDFKDVFCPPIHVLNEYAASGEDPEGIIRQHLETCPSCKATVEALAVTDRERVEVPSPLMEAFRKEYKKKSLTETLHVIFSNLFNLPVIAFATAATAVLVVVLLYPIAGVETRIALSPVKWEPELMLMAPESDKPRVAVIIFVKGSGQSWPQERIDKLYESLKPPKSVRDRVEVLSPAKVFDSIGQQPKNTDRSQLLKKLHEDLDATSALIVTIAPDDNQFTIEEELKDTQSGKAVGNSKPRKVNQAGLSSTIWNAAVPLLTSQGTE